MLAKHVGGAPRGVMGPDFKIPSIGLIIPQKTSGIHRALIGEPEIGDFLNKPVLNAKLRF